MSETAGPLPRHRAGLSPAVILTSVLFVELVVFVLGIALGARGWDLVILLLALATAFLAAGPIVFDVSRPAERRQILISLLTFVYVVFLVVPVFTQYFLMKGEPVRGLFRLSESLPTNVAHAQLVALIGLVALLLGFYTPFGRIAAAATPKPTRDWTPQATFAVAAITLGLGWLVTIPIELGFVPMRVGSGAVGALAAGSYFGISLLALAWLRQRSRPALMLILIIVPLAMIFNFFTGSKRAVLTPPFMVAVSYILYERRIRKSWLLAGLLTLIVLYPFAQFYRELLDTTRVLGVKAFVQNPAAVVAALSDFAGSADLGKYISAGLEATGRRLDALGTLSVIVRDTPERVPYQGGWTIGLIFVSYIPRLIWPGKPTTTTGTWVSQNYGSQLDLHTNVGPSWIGELYFNWGYIGVVLGMAVMGILLRILQERLFDARAPIPALFGAAVVLYCCCRSVQASLIAPINCCVYNLIPVMMAHLFVGLVGGYKVSRSRVPGTLPATSSAASDSG